MNSPLNAPVALSDAELDCVVGGASTASTPVHFDRGTGVDSQALAETAALSLPSRTSEGDPLAQASNPALSQLLARPDLSSHLADALRPPADKPELLTPTRFASSMRDAVATLDTTSGAHEDAKVLNRAVRQLNEETGLRDLVSMCKHALYQG